MEAIHDWSSLYAMEKEGQIISESIYLVLERNGYRIQKPFLKKKLVYFFMNTFKSLLYKAFVGKWIY
jgi:hypothetical protein